MKKIVLYLFLFIVFCTLKAQNNSYLFRHLSTFDGLSQSSVIAIHQDRLGQIWIGTRDGLNKYDGTKFTVYRNQENNSSSISNNDILSIHEDNDGFLWVGTYNGLNKYNPKTDLFTRYFHDEKSSSLSNNTIWIIKTLSNGKVWLGTSEGLSIYNKEEDSFSNYLNTFERPIQKRIMCVMEASNGDVFVGTGAGIYKLSSLNENIFEFTILKGSEDFYVQDLVEGFNENILIASRNNGVISYDLVSRMFSSYLETDNTIGNNDKNVRKLLFDIDNNLWIGTYNGLKIVSRDKSVVALRADIDNKNGLSKNSIKYLFEDIKNSIWIGTYYGGINIWDDSNVNFRNITQNRIGKGLSYNVVSSIEYYKNNIYFGTEGGGVTIWDRNKNTYSYILKKNTSLSDNNIKSLRVINNTLWIGTFKNGLDLYDLRTKQFLKNKLPENLREFIKNAGVYAIKRDRFNNVWIGTFGQGLFKYNPETKDFKRFYESDNIKSTLSNNLVRAICIDSQNNIWVSTEKGLNRIDNKDIVSTFFYDETLQYGDDILCVFEDIHKNLWVGTKSKGLYKYDATTFKPVNLSVNDINISSVHSIHEDNKEQLWISTNQGLVKYNSKQNEIEIYNQTDGIVSNEFNDNSSLKLGESEFYFGGPTGVTYFDSNKLITNSYTPQVILTDFNIKENDYKKSKVNTVLQNTLPYTKSINLSHTQGNFSISFSIPNFINPSNNNYKYRLKGLEKEWNLTTSNTASYTIQNPGNYVFEVKGANSDNVWNEGVTQLKIYVAPAPWRTWWAFTIYGLLIILALYFLLDILKSRTKLRHDLQLEYLETEKTKEINKDKLQFFTNISHEFRTPLALILGPLNQIIENYRGSSNVYKKLLVIDNNANHLLHLINRLMDFRKFENNLYKLQAAEGNIVKFLREIYLSFTEFAKNGNYEFDFICDEDTVLVYYDRNKLERVFYNLISNAFRYTPKGGKIVIRVKKNENSLNIYIEDTGVGIAKEYHDKIFERFFEVAVNNKPDNNYNKGTGIGLSIAKNIVELHKGTIEVKSNLDDKGSIFSVSLLLGSTHLNETEILQDFKFSDDVSQYIEQLNEPKDFIEDAFVEDIKEEDKQTILIVEDHKPLRKFIKSLLKGQYNVIETENGKLALKKAKKEAPDLIVSDVIMPEMTGTELCSAIKEDLKTSHIPIILLTSRSSLIYKIDGLELGADDYISKPFNINEFKLRVKNLLQTREKLRKKFVSNEGLKPEDILVSSYDEKLYKKALLIVNENISNEDFDITYFCAELGVSRTMLFTKIKAWSNFTPNDFIQHFRMKRAAQLLEQGKINISQVSYQVGYRDPKYFSKSFQKKFGETPSKYASKFSD
ncbi:two-component regulator propeller domain-containing protein [uncultured Algibacter sp.]|uniref:hybrid sensor histidine kinase/response regulator n=1 Tax=uncultured Algibacter sp. TaxID=298659 RepID=UPI00260D3C58|nr:two-component regulator propeller domain-containing protein [uncultured Algibacter sp.]